MSRYRNNLAYGEYYYSPTPAPAERWDRERFERARAQSRGPRRESESIKFEEDVVYTRGGGAVERKDIRVDIDERRRGSRESYDVYAERARPVRPEYVDRYEIRERDLAPYRPRYEKPSAPRNARPVMLRRQTSLDIFDRPPQPRYDQEERDINVNVNFAPPEGPRYEYKDEDYRDVRIRRERERDIYRRKRESSSSSSSTEAEVIVKEKKIKKGKTRFPKRLVHLKAILDLGFPYEEEEYFYFVLVALKKDKVDEVIERSKTYFREETIKIDETKLLEAPAPPSEAGGTNAEESGEEEVIETKTTRIIENPTPEELARLRNASRAPTSISPSVAASIKSPSPTRSGRRGRSSSRPRGSEIFAEEKEVDRETTLALVLPSRDKSRNRLEIDEEIRRLELEKRAIRRGERRRERERELEEETVVEEVDVEVDKRRDVRLHRDEHGHLSLERPSRRSKSSRRRPTQRDIKTATYVLT